jgi:mannose PTS system EIIA component
MFEILVVGHGPFAEGLVGEARAIVGDDANRALVLSLAPDEGLEGFSIRVAAHLADWRPALILADLSGGTPANAALMAARDRKVRVIGGANLGMLLDVLYQPAEASLTELAKAATRAGREGVRDVSAALGLTGKGGDDD